jgi:hypothetical protein
MPEEIHIVISEPDDPISVIEISGNEPSVFIESIERGPEGLSTYEIALKYGFEGSEEEWLNAADSSRILAEAAADSAEQSSLLASGFASDSSLSFLQTQEYALLASGYSESSFLNFSGASGYAYQTSGYAASAEENLNSTYSNVLLSSGFLDQTYINLQESSGFSDQAEIYANNASGFNFSSSGFADIALNSANAALSGELSANNYALAASGFASESNEFALLASGNAYFAGLKADEAKDSADAAAASAGIAAKLSDNGLTSTGKILSINSGNASFFDVAAGSGVLGGESFAWEAQTGITVQNIGNSTVSYIYISAEGDTVQSTTPPTPESRRANLFLGQLGHTNNLSIANAVNTPDYAPDGGDQFRDFLRCVGIYSCGGNIVSANGSNLSIDISAGELFGIGINLENTADNPNQKDFAALTPATFRRRTINGQGANGATTLDVGNYDNGAAITPISGTKYQNFRVYRLVSGNIIVQYGRAIYNSMSAALDGLPSEPFIPFLNVTEIGAEIGIITVRSTATNLSDPAQAKFSSSLKIGGAGVSIAAVTGEAVRAAIEEDALAARISIGLGSNDIVSFNSATLGTLYVTAANISSFFSPGQTRQALGITTVGDDIVTSTTPALARSAIELGSNNDVSFKSVKIGNNIVTEADSFTLSESSHAGKYIRLTKADSTQTITLPISGITTGSEFPFFVATSQTISLTGATVNGGDRLSDVEENSPFALKYIGSGIYDFI